MALDGTGSELVLIPLSGNNTPVLSRFSARGLHQTLGFIQTQKPRRTINGRLINTVPDAFRQYRSVISCTDNTRSPGVDDTWKGREVEVWCVAELSFPAGASPQRPEVSGSSHMDPVSHDTYYRPVLIMMVMDLELTHDEWGRVIGWTMELEEVAPPA